MKRILIGMLLLLCLAAPVSAAEITAPQVPDAGEMYMPEDTQSFGQALWDMVKDALGAVLPDLREAAGICLGVMAVVLLVSILGSFPEQASRAPDFVGTAAVAALLLSSAHSLIQLGRDTITEISEYGKLLLPVMTSAMAAQGGITSSAALYAGTAVFDTVLTGLIHKLLLPMVYFFLAMSVANSALGDDMLEKMANFLKWLMSWGLKIILYVFTGYMSITGVVSGTTDAATLKAAKLTISGAVPVVGSILADASEAVLVSAGILKNSAGIYGIIAILAVVIGPFLKIGAHYLLLKITAAVCGVFGSKRMCGMIEAFSTAMGLMLAMTGSMCLLLLISTVCFLRGVG